MANFFSTYVSNPYLFLALVIAFFLFVGTFMDAIPAMILFIPVILPVAVKLGISPIHLGIIVVMTLAIGLVTPPYGLCLLIASSIADLSIEKSLRGVLPYISADMLVVIIITLIPAVALFFPKLLGLM